MERQGSEKIITECWSENKETFRMYFGGCDMQNELLLKKWCW